MIADEAKKMPMRVIRQDPTLRVTIEHRFGPMLGDSSTYTVSRAGRRVTFRKGDRSFDVPLEVAERMTEALLEVTSWEDEK